MVRAELADEKAQHGLTKQLLSNLFSGPDPRIQELQNQAQSLGIKIWLLIQISLLLQTRINRIRICIWLLPNNFSPDSQKIAKEAEVEADRYRCEQCTKLLCVEALNIIHDTIAPYSPALDPTSPDFFTAAQQVGISGLSTTRLRCDRIDSEWNVPLNEPICRSFGGGWHF